MKSKAFEGTIRSSGTPLLLYLKQRRQRMIGVVIKYSSGEEESIWNDGRNTKLKAKHLHLH